ncbi:malate synthase [Deinococcus hopiensis KR-140]|uniref:malate synthase n=2 Tax=Deinococcus TaxID=1298 RepID=A0A1W1UHI4_9DEIO|nr:malate synthase [Deinococcus hopiensis KR-140]
MPPALERRKVEQLVEASDSVALEAALAAGPDALIFDFDDTFSPTPENVRRGQANLAALAAVDGPLPMLRPRPLYMRSGGGGSASIEDVSAFVGALPERAFLCIYIPKLEFPMEAVFWNDLLAELERLTARPPNSIRVCLQIETLPGAFYAEELLYALRERAFGLNAGRWDYVFSAIKWRSRTSGACLPPRSALHMGQPAMQAYEQHLARICARRGAQAIGGTAALAPDAQHPAPALAVVRADKEREASWGYVAAWAGLPELIATVREVFENPPPVTPIPERSEAEVAAALLGFPEAGQVSEVEVREATAMATDYFRAWLGGRGVIVRKGRVEDTATAELARTLLWHWLRQGVLLDSGDVLTSERFGALLQEEANPSEVAARLLRSLVLAPAIAPFFPTVAQALQEADSA